MTIDGLIHLLTIIRNDHGNLEIIGDNMTDEELLKELNE